MVDQTEIRAVDDTVVVYPLAPRPNIDSMNKINFEIGKCWREAQEVLFNDIDSNKDCDDVMFEWPDIDTCNIKHKYNSDKLPQSRRISIVTGDQQQVY